MSENYFDMNIALKQDGTIAVTFGVSDEADKNPDVIAHQIAILLEGLTTGILNQGILRSLVLAMPPELHQKVVKKWDGFKHSNRPRYQSVNPRDVLKPYMRPAT